MIGCVDAHSWVEIASRWQNFKCDPCKGKCAGADVWCSWAHSEEELARFSKGLLNMIMIWGTALRDGRLVDRGRGVLW